MMRGDNWRCYICAYAGQKNKQTREEIELFSQWTLDNCFCHRSLVTFPLHNVVVVSSVCFSAIQWLTPIAMDCQDNYLHLIIGIIIWLTEHQALVNIQTSWVLFWIIFELLNFGQHKIFRLVPICPLWGFKKSLQTETIFFEDVETFQRGDFDFWSPQLGKFFSFRILPSSSFQNILGKSYISRFCVCEF